MRKIFDMMRKIRFPWAPACQRTIPTRTVDYLSYQSVRGERMKVGDFGLHYRVPPGILSVHAATSTY